MRESFRHMAARFSMVFAVGGLVLGFSGVGYAIFTLANVTQRINDERARNTLIACQQTNERHKTVTVVIGQLVKRPVTPRHLTPDQQKRQAEATAKFVQALVPKRDCEALVHAQVKQ